MKHCFTEHDGDYGVDVECVNEMDFDGNGHLSLQHVELEASVYLGGGTEHIGCINLGSGVSKHWTPIEIRLIGASVVVKFHSGKFVGIPLSRVRHYEPVLVKTRNTKALNLAKARAAKAKKADQS